MNLLSPWIVTLALFLSVARLWAGGSGLNVVVVVNQNSTNSVQLGNYFMEQRQVPPQNLLHINWAGGNTEWSLTDYTNTLLNPFLAMLAGRQLTNQIDYVVLSMDIPYRVAAPGNGYCSTTSSLFYGFKPDTNDLNTCPMANGSTNLYAGSEGIFRLTPPISFTSNSFLATMITASNLTLAKKIVNQGVISDGTFPSQSVNLLETTDTIRNVRYLEFDNSVFNTRLRGNYSMQRSDAFTNASLNVIVPTNLLGFQDGYFYFDVESNNFVPGAMADNLTSFGGQLFESSGQSPILGFLAAGASGSYGTVIEPCNYPQKFPDPQNYFFQARGLSLAECYYQSVLNPYQGLVMGEPLAAPFATPGNGSWTGLGANPVMSGTTNLSLHFTASDTQHPLQRVDLFLDGTWLQTVTNIAPATGDNLHVTINGFQTNHIVALGETIAAVTSNLDAALSDTLFQIDAETVPFLHGDRIELQSTNFAKTGSQVSISVSSTNASGTSTTFIHASQGTFLDSIAEGYKSFELTGTPNTSSYLQLAVTKTNGSIVNVSVTNTSNGTLTQLAQQLFNAIASNSGLTGINGLVGDDLQTDPSTGNAYFNLVANGQGFAAAQIQANLTTSAGLTEIQNEGNALIDNLSDLVPRNHLYITAGTTNLSVTFPFNTTALADGWHILTAVAYEGSHVRTQTRTQQNIQIHNNALIATLTTIVGGANTALEATMQFAVNANTSNISTIQLFSTGGMLAAATNQSTANFSVSAGNLGIGLHPFYAIVTDTNGKQYRTQTRSIRIVGPDSPFLTQLMLPPPLLTWPAAAGRSYDILGSTNAAGPYAIRTSVVPTNSLGQWLETNTSPVKQFYRVRVTP